MDGITRTSSVLLLGLADPANQTAWSEFDGRYRPIVTRFAMRMGLQEAEAHDAAQETLLCVMQDFRAGKFDHRRGRLRAWLFTVARSRIVEAQRALARRHEVRGQSALANLEDDASLSKSFDEEWRRELLRTALDELRAVTRTEPQTLRAFELLVIERRPVTAVAEELGMNVNAVYVAKHRTMERMRAIVARLKEDF
jgi:RNA polymerase sigma factor (sigma-70 family)